MQFSIADFKNNFIKSVIGDIEKASKGGAKAGAFILASCAFEYLAGYMTGRETTRKDYINFIKRFVTPFEPRYNPEYLYSSLRCGLVHNYTIKKSKYALTDANPGLHFARNVEDSSQKILNLEDFISILKKACNEFFNTVETDVALRKSLEKYLNNIGFLAEHPVIFGKPGTIPPSQ